MSIWSRQTVQVHVPRPIRWADLEAVAAIEAEAYPDAWDADDVRRSLCGHNDHGLVVGVPVSGYAIWTDRPGSIRIDRLAVTSRWRRDGIGAVMIGTILRHARESGRKQIDAMVRERSTAALMLLKHQGFAWVRTFPCKFRDTKEDGYLMRRWLT